MATLSEGTALQGYVWGEWQKHAQNSYTSSTVSYDSSWDRWNSTTCSGTSEEAVSNSVVWYTWNQQPAEFNNEVEVTITDNSGHVVWRKWVDQYDVHDVRTLEEYRGRAQATVNEAVKKLKAWEVPSTETLRAQKAQQEIRRIWNKIREEEMKQEKEEAENYALDLLLELIGEDEHRRYKETGQLFVKGKHHYDYIVKKDGGVYRLEKDKVVDFAKKKEAEGKFICVHPENRFAYPETDNVISLKMWIENNEKKFLRVGNQHLNVTKLKDFDKVVGL